MKNSISSILSRYGFETKHNGSQWWGIGSLVWGYTATVRNLGSDMYEINYHNWQYDCDGECVFDKTMVSNMHGAKLLEFIFENMPVCRYIKYYVK